MSDGADFTVLTGRLRRHKAQREQVLLLVDLLLLRKRLCPYRTHQHSISCTLCSGMHLALVFLHCRIYRPGGIFIEGIWKEGIVQHQMSPLELLDVLYFYEES